MQIKPETTCAVKKPGMLVQTGVTGGFISPSTLSDNAAAILIMVLKYGFGSVFCGLQPQKTLPNYPFHIFFYHIENY